MKTERKPKSTFVRNNKAQMGTVLAVVTGSITVLIAVIIFASVYHALPETGPAVNNETWAFNGSVSSTFTKTLTNANLIETNGVKVYNSSYVFMEDTDYTVDYNAGKVTNKTTGAIGAHADFVNYTDSFGVDYEYEETGVVNVKASVASIFYSAIGLVIIGFLVLAAVFILAVVGRLRGKGE